MLTNYKHTQPTLHQVIPWFTKVKYFIHFFADLKICENTNSIRVMLQEHNQNRKKNRKKDGKRKKMLFLCMFILIIFFKSTFINSATIVNLAIHDLPLSRYNYVLISINLSTIFTSL